MSPEIIPHSDAVKILLSSTVKNSVSIEFWLLKWACVFFKSWSESCNKCSWGLSSDIARYEKIFRGTLRVTALSSMAKIHSPREGTWAAFMGNVPCLPQGGWICPISVWRLVIKEEFWFGKNTQNLQFSVAECTRSSAISDPLIETRRVVEIKNQKWNRRKTMASTANCFNWKSSSERKTVRKPNFD